MKLQILLGTLVGLFVASVGYGSPFHGSDKVLKIPDPNPVLSCDTPNKPGEPKPCSSCSIIVDIPNLQRGQPITFFFKNMPKGKKHIANFKGTIKVKNIGSGGNHGWIRFNLEGTMGDLHGRMKINCRRTGLMNSLRKRFPVQGNQSPKIGQDMSG